MTVLALLGGLQPGPLAHSNCVRPMCWYTCPMNAAHACAKSTNSFCTACAMRWTVNYLENRSLPYEHHGLYPSSFFKLPLAALALALSAGCAPLVIGGAALGSALVVTDRRTSGTQLEDEGIELRAASPRYSKT